MDRYSFVERGPRLDFCAGSTVDFLAWKVWDGNYRLAVDDYCARYEKLLVWRLSGPYTDLKLQLALDAQARRERFLHILSWRHGLDQEGMHAVHRWIDKHHLDQHRLRLTLFAVKGGDINQLLGNERFTASKAFAVLPILANPYTVCALEIINPETEVRTLIEIEPYAHGYSGLLGLADPMLEPVAVICPGGVEMLKQHCQLGLSQTPACVMGAYFFRAGEANHYQLPRAIVQEAEGTQALSFMLRCRQLAETVMLVPQLQQLGGPKTLLETHIRELAETRAAAEVPGTALSLDVHQFIGEVHQHSNLYKMVETTLSKILPEAQMQELQDVLGANVHFQYRNADVWEAPSGYHIQKGHAPRTQVTNFVIKAQRRLFFPGHSQSFLTGDLLFKKHRVPFTLLSETKRGEEIEKFLRDAAQAAMPPGEEGLPALVDPTYANVLASVFSQLNARVPLVQGIYRLGWDSSRTKFSASFWTADSYGAKLAPQVAYPHSDIFKKYYQFSDPMIVESPQMDLLSAEAKLGTWTLLSIVVAWMLRAYHELATPPVKVEQSEDSLALLKAIFQAFGQVRPIPLSGNIRRNDIRMDPEVAGIPVYATCANDAVFKHLHSPVFFLAANGLRCPKLSPEHLQQVTRISLALFQELSAAVLRNPDVKLTTDIKEECPTLMREGKEFIQHYTSFRDVPTTLHDLPKLYRLLERIPLADVPRYFYKSVTAERGVIVLKDELEGQSQILEELQQLDPEASRVSQYIRVNEDILRGILANFYGGQVDLRLVHWQFVNVPGAPDNIIEFRAAAS